MSKRSVNFVPGEFYHIFNRGNSKQEIFHDNTDYHRFLKLLYTTNSDSNMTIRDFSKDVYDKQREDPLVAIGAYCLMPNHFHLLITPQAEDGVSRFMHKLGTAYSMYHNNKYGRSGGLFEGKFKSEYASDDRHLKYLFSYIHLNPLKLIDSKWKEKDFKGKTQLIQFLETYKFSSYMDYLNIGRSDAIILDRIKFPEYFPSKSSFKSEILEWATLA
ncbi:hypothetical protein BH11PAT3_BH11PAT3_0170 [soil metagenome]